VISLTREDAIFWISLTFLGAGIYFVPEQGVSTVVFGWFLMLAGLAGLAYSTRQLWKGDVAGVYLHYPGRVLTVLTFAGVIAGAFIERNIESFAQPTQVSVRAQTVGPSAKAEEVLTDLRLHFLGGHQAPQELHQDNVFGWYTLWNEGVTMKGLSPEGKLLGEATTNPWWWIFVIFDHPVSYHELTVSFSSPGFPSYEVKQSTTRSVIIVVQGDIPAGDMEIYAVLAPPSKAPQY